MTLKIELNEDQYAALAEAANGCNQVLSLGGGKPRRGRRLPDHRHGQNQGEEGEVKLTTEDTEGTERNKHTPGPWDIHTCNENGPFLDSFYLSTPADYNECERKCVRIICRFPTGTGQFFDMGRENLANAHLISAAPDLLVALKQCIPLVAAYANAALGDGGMTLVVAREAIAKAEGRNGK